VSGGQGPLRAGDLRQLVAARYAVLDAESRRTRRSPSVEAVHRTRVAARSLRSLLATLKPLLHPAMYARARRDLRNLAAALGDAREADVRRHWLEALAAGSGALPPGAYLALVERLERDREEARRQLSAHLRSATCRERAARLAATLGDRRFVRGRKGVDGIVRARLDRRWKRLRRALRKRSHDTAALHELRLAIKHARYASEALAPWFGPAPGATLRNLKRLQDCLGDHRDATQALEWLGRLGEPVGPVLSGHLRGPIGRVQARRLRELDRLAGKFEVPSVAPAATVSRGRRRPAARSARSSGPRRRRSPSS
jgi:CHAD domain-containing protein